MTPRQLARLQDYAATFCLGVAFALVVFSAGPVIKGEAARSTGEVVLR